MTRSAQETIELFWKTQDDRDYTRLVELFAEDAVVEDQPRTSRNSPFR